MNTRQRGKRRSSTAIWVVSAIAVILAGSLIGASLWSTRDGGSAAPSGEVLSDADRGAVRNAMGPEGAPVTVIEYMDYA